MAGRLGNHAAILSRIGRDDLGRQALENLEQLDQAPADAEFVQVDPAHETGRVRVGLEEGQASYTILEPSAWDFLELTDEWVQLAERANAICFGTLAQRRGESRRTIQTLVGLTQEECVKVFDVNLRAPFYSDEVIQESVELASVVKMNDDEVPLVLGLLGLDSRVSEANPHPSDEDLSLGTPRPGVPGMLREGAERLLEEFPGLQMVAVTRGGEGSLLVRRGEWHQHPGIPVKVVDTIGAGDAFTAAMTHYLLRGADLATLNEAGNRWGSWVASQAGAMPVLPEGVRAELSAAIEGTEDR
jgi:fructokinase